MNILVTITVHDDYKKQMQEIVPNADFVFTSDPTEENIIDADAIIGNAPPQTVAKCTHLRWLQLPSAGADAFCKPGVLPQGTLLTNATGAYGPGISEHMIGCLLMFFRHLHLYNRQQTDHIWQELKPMRNICGTTTLCIGLGDIGTAFCRKMHAFGSYTIGVKRRPGEKPEGVDELYLNDAIDELLPKADIIALCLPGTDATRNLMHKERFKKLKKDAVLINIGRGSSVNTDDLVEALQDGALGGAILDVTNPEPLPKDHPLWSFENVVITPHISGNGLFADTQNRIAQIAVNNLKAFIAGEDLPNLVDLSSGYKK